MLDTKATFMQGPNVAIIVAQAERVARGILNPFRVSMRRQGDIADFSIPEDMEPGEAALNLMTLTIEDYLESGKTDSLQIFAISGAAGIGASYKKAAFAGVDPREVLLENPDFVREQGMIDAIESFIATMECIPENVNIGINYLGNLDWWFLKYADGVELKDGDKLVFHRGKTLDGSVAISGTNKLNGEREVELRKGRPVIKRVGNNTFVRNCRQLRNMLWQRCPAIELTEAYFVDTSDKSSAAQEPIEQEALAA